MMDQIEFENLVAKLKKRKEEGDIKTAIKVANKIPWDEVEDINLLMYVASIYEEGENYKDAKLILEYAYEIAPVKNRLYFALCLINAKCKELKDAISYFIDFDKSFPDDNRKKLLEYYILKAKKASYEQLKRVLSEYLSEEKDEKMSFELAIICDKLGETKEALEICNFIVDFYGVKKNGYGKNALLLKKKYTELNSDEERMLLDAEIGYVKDEDAEIEFKEPLQFYNETRLEEERTNLEVEKVPRDLDKDSNTKEDEDDELNEKDVPNSISISYTPDEESYAEKEKNKMAFLSKERDDKAKLRKLISELKEEERIQNSKFNKFRQKSFERRGRFKNMKLSDTKLHMIIEAHSRDEGTDIAKKELEYIHSILGEKATIAKASAYNMNEKGFRYYAEKTKDRDLIIENAGQLKNDILDDIEEFIINRSGKTIFALVDVINNFDKIASERPAFIGRFDIYSVLSSRPQETLDADEKEIEEFKEERDKKYISGKITPASREAVKEYDDGEKINIESKRHEEKLYDDRKYEDRKFDDRKYEDREYEDRRYEEREKEERQREKIEREERQKEERERVERERIEREREEREREERIREERKIEERKHEEARHDDLRHEPSRNDEITREDTRRVKASGMSVDEFVDECKSYAKSIDCALPGATIPALYEKVEEMKESNVPLTRENAEALIEEAADRAEKPKLFRKPKYDKDGCLVLLEEHFNF